jgi:molecular chaperone IbpA
MTTFEFRHNFLPKEFDRFFVGIDPFMKKLNDAAEFTAKNMTSNYPPYNIKKLDEVKYVIEMAVAGFDQKEIDVEFANDKLTIKGKVQDKEETDKQYLYHGLARRSFERVFTLADNVEIRNASLNNGILKIELEAVIPEHKKPKKIALTSSANQELLVEGK